MKCRLHLGVRPQTILFICEQSEATARPWQDAGFSTICVDLAVDGQDARLIRLPDVLALLKRHGLLPRGLFAMPPCTHLAGSGARWWAGKGEAALLEALSVVDACYRLAEMLRPVGLRWFALENPVGRLSHYLGQPVMTFQPYEFGETYSKRTCLWGWGFNRELARTPVEPTDKARMWNLPPTPDRARLRTVAPAGFAKAFCDANKLLAA